MKITAVMVTGAIRGFPRMAQVAVECFHNQDYPDRELLVINQGSVDYSGPNIKQIFVYRPFSLYVGIFRNMAFHFATGDYLMTWDDDDWYSPQRMSFQAPYAAPNTIVMVKNRIQGDLQTGVYGVRASEPGFMGSMLYPKATEHRFLNVQNGSDAVFASNFENQIVLDNPPELYVRNWHGQNLTAREEVMRNLTPLVVGQAELIERLKAIYH